MFFSVALLQGAPGPAPRQLGETLTALSRNIQQYEDVAPDFLCNERITSTSFKNGKKQDQKIVEAIYSIRQSREHREILTIDGKPAKKDAKMPGLPVNITGSFNYMINVAFSLKSREWYTFELGQPEENGKLVVRFETKNEQKAMIWNINGDQRPAHDTGVAWIDPSSMQVSRLERNLLNLTRNLSGWKITIDQAPFMIGDRTFWLPKSFLTEITERDVTKTGTFLAEYSNCKKFTTEITIRPVQ